jgi:hypothetical protein
MDDFAQLTELMDCFQNFKSYRQCLAQIDPDSPCLPYVGLLLTDITFICEGIYLLSLSILAPFFRAKIPDRPRKSLVFSPACKNMHI